MKVEYDKEADALYIQLREAYVDDNIDIEEGVTVDLDEKKHTTLALEGSLITPPFLLTILLLKPLR